MKLSRVRSHVSIQILALALGVLPSGCGGSDASLALPGAPRAAQRNRAMGEFQKNVKPARPQAKKVRNHP